MLLTSFVQASSQWRKVQDRLEDDERCSCLEKIDRLEIFQVVLIFLTQTIFLTSHFVSTSIEVMLQPFFFFLLFCTLGIYT